jgi:hypothetical protein
MAVTGVQVNRRNKDRYDLGIRRWLADAGCGYDLVQTSIVGDLGGQLLIRLREPKYLQTANGVTSLHHEITMYIPQLDELAEILRVRNTPSAISIGKTCVEMGYCFHWPQYSESPFFVKPDGTRVTCSVENNIPYLEGGYDDNACPGFERPTQAVDGRPGSLDDEIDEHATPREDESSQDANMVPQGGEPNVRDDDGDGTGASHRPGDVEPACSRDFRDTANEALAVRHLATRKPKLNSCETCRQSEAQRIKHLRAARKSESRMRKSRGPIPVKFGDQITLDQIVCHRDNNHGCGGETNAITMIDRALSFRWAKGLTRHTAKGLTRHTAANNLQVVQEFQGAREEDKIKYMCSDSAVELLYVSRRMGIGGFHDTNIPGDSQGNGVAENNNRDVKSGTAALLSHAGMPLAYWPYAIQCYCFGRNSAVVDRESPYGKRFLAYGGNFDQSKMFVFGSAVRFIPSKVTGDKTNSSLEAHNQESSWDME